MSIAIQTNPLASDNSTLGLQALEKSHGLNTSNSQLSLSRSHPITNRYRAPVPQTPVCQIDRPGKTSTSRSAHTPRPFPPPPPPHLHSPPPPEQIIHSGGGVEESTALHILLTAGKKGMVDLWDWNRYADTLYTARTCAGALLRTRLVCGIATTADDKEGKRCRGKNPTRQCWVSVNINSQQLGFF